MDGLFTWRTISYHCKMTIIRMLPYFHLSFNLLLAKFIFPDTKYPNKIVNRTITKLTQDDWDWIENNCGFEGNSKSHHFQTSFKIINGERVKPGEMPWAVLVTSTTTRRFKNDKGKEVMRLEIDNICSGTLISKQHLLTAAHCFLDTITTMTKIENKTTYVPYHTNLMAIGPYGTSYKSKIMIGVNSDMLLFRNEKARFLSPDFIPRTAKDIFDYAIIEFEPPLEEEDLHIALPACLPFDGLDISIGTTLVTAGWGKTVEGKEAAGALDHLMFRETARKNCIDPDIENDFVCTDQITLQGDSGAGLMKMFNNRAFLIGIQRGYFINSNGFCEYYFWPFGCKQSYGLILNPENPSPILGVSSPLRVIAKELECVVS